MALAASPPHPLPQVFDLYQKAEQSKDRLTKLESRQGEFQQRMNRLEESYAQDKKANAQNFVTLGAQVAKLSAEQKKTSDAQVRAAVLCPSKAIT